MVIRTTTEISFLLHTHLPDQGIVEMEDRVYGFQSPRGVLSPAKRLKLQHEGYRHALMAGSILRYQGDDQHPRLQISKPHSAILSNNRTLE